MNSISISSKPDLVSISSLGCGGEETLQRLGELCHKMHFFKRPPGSRSWFFTRPGPGRRPSMGRVKEAASVGQGVRVQEWWEEEIVKSVPRHDSWDGPYLPISWGGLGGSMYAYIPYMECLGMSGVYYDIVVNQGSTMG